MLQSLGQNRVTERASSNLFLKITCRNVKQTEDTMLVIARRLSDKEAWVPYLRSERQRESNEPVFVSPLQIPWQIWSIQHLRFVLVDMRDTSNLQNVDLDDAIAPGCAIFETTLAYLLRSASIGTFRTPIAFGERLLLRTGTINEATMAISKAELKSDDPIMMEIQITEKPTCRSTMQLSSFLSKLKIENKCIDWRPVLRIFNKVDDSNCEPIYESKIPPRGQKFTKKTQLDTFSLKLQDLCDGNTSAPLYFKISHFDVIDREIPIGEFSTSVDLLEASKKIKITKKNNPEKIAGFFNVESFKITASHSFFTFVSRGIRPRLFIGIDFTASNKEYSDSTSLHYLGKSWFGNPYIRVLKAIVTPIEEIQEKKLHYAAAFGCSKYIEDYVSVYPITKRRDSLSIVGLESVINSYMDSLTFHTLSGPGLVSPLLRYFLDQVERLENVNMYNVFLVITDGVIPDVQETIEQLDRAAKAPVSLIFVGVGKENFSALRQFCERQFGSKEYLRTLTTFVALEDFEGSNHEGELVACASLSQLPSQAAEYYNLCESQKFK